MDEAEAWVRKAVAAWSVLRLAVRQMPLKRKLQDATL